MTANSGEHLSVLDDEGRLPRENIVAVMADEKIVGKMNSIGQKENCDLNIAFKISD